MIEGRQTETYVNIVPIKELFGVPNMKTTKTLQNPVLSSNSLRFLLC